MAKIYVKIRIDMYYFLLYLCPVNLERYKTNQAFMQPYGQITNRVTGQLPVARALCAYGRPVLPPPINIISQFKYLAQRVICLVVQGTCLVFRGICLILQVICLALRGTCLAFQVICLALRDTCLAPQVICLFFWGRCRAFRGRCRIVPDTLPFF